MPITPEMGGRQRPADVKHHKLKVDQPKKSRHLSSPSTTYQSLMPPSNSPSTARSSRPGSNQENPSSQGQAPRGPAATRQILQNKVNEQEAELQRLKGAESLKR